MKQKETNPFFYSDDNKRYHTLAYDHHRRFGRRVYKAALDAGFTCPNRDRTRGASGCLFCKGGSGYFTKGALPVSAQLEAEAARVEAKDPAAGIIAYFQAGSNTYAPVEALRVQFEPALLHPKVCGLSVATRADCLPGPVLDYLADLNRRCSLTVELGLQTTNNETARRIRRGHDFQTFLVGYQALKDRGIRVCVHLICGLPGENETQMVESARVLGALRPDGVKLHLLHVIEETDLAALYRAGAYTPLTKAAYVETVVRQLEQLPPETVVERLTGDGDRKTLLAPLWSRDKRRVLGEIDQVLYRRGTYQGYAFLGKSMSPDRENK
jgi:radical SAM protein (TIGR01212 family)